MYFKILAKKRHGIVKLNIKYNIQEKTIFYPMIKKEKKIES